MTLGNAALLAYTLLMLGLVRWEESPVQPDLLGMVLVCLAWLVCGVGLLLEDRAARRPPGKLLVSLLTVLAVENLLLWHRVSRPVPELHLGGRSVVPFLVWMAGTFILALTWATPRLARLRIWLVIGLSMGAGSWALLGWGDDDGHIGNICEIDVLYFQTEAARELLSGRNPYAHRYENIYPNTDFYGEKLLRDGKVVSFPYPPATIGANIIGYGLGDVRWGNLLALVCGSAFVIMAGRRTGLAAGHPAELAVVLLLLHPCTGLVLLRGWTEPLVFCAAAFCLWSLVGPPGWRRGLGLGVLFSAKQITPLWLPALVMSGRVSWWAILGGGLWALALALPFLLWDAAAFWEGMVAFHVNNTFRADSLALPHWCTRQRERSFRSWLPSRPWPWCLPSMPACAARAWPRRRLRADWHS